MRRVLLLALALLTVSAILTPSTWAASTHGAPAPTEGVEVPLFPAPSLTAVPPHMSINARQALAVAKTSPRIQAIHRTQHPLQFEIYEETGGQAHWEIFFFHGKKLLADVVVDPNGRLGPTLTGPLITGVYARGHYAGIFDSPWVWAPFAFLFVVPFVRLRRWRSLMHLDLAVILSFGLSYWLFNHAHVEAAVWLFYPPLLYLLARMLRIGFGRHRWGGTPDSGLPAAVLLAGLVVLVAARVVLALDAKAVIDVGYASVIGAHRILHGQSLYYASLGHPDTYGPVAFLAYVPFEAIWPWHGTWDYLPAARAASIAFDVLTAGGLLLLGTRLRPGPAGRRLGLLLAWGWAACPFTLLALMEGTNDSLTSLLLVGVLLALSSPIGRSALLGLAAAAKFFPALLLPLILVGRGEDRDPKGARKRSLVSFVVVTLGSIALFLPSGGLQELFDHTIGFQLSRPDIFSIWALHPTLAPIKVIVEVAAVGLAVLVAVRPRGPRSTSQVAGLGAAVIIAAQLPGLHWFYFYIVWFLPMVLVALLVTTDVPPEPVEKVLEPDLDVRRPPAPVLVESVA